MGVAEAWVPAQDLPLYLRPDELANSFNFQFLDSKWDAKILKKNIKETFKNLAGSTAPAGATADVEMSSESLDFVFLNDFGYDTLTVTGSAALNGTLIPTLLGTAVTTIQPTDTFKIITFASSSGLFLNVPAPGTRLLLGRRQRLASRE